MDLLSNRTIRCSRIYALQWLNLKATYLMEGTRGGGGGAN